jgi:hypothetical protein
MIKLHETRVISNNHQRLYEISRMLSHQHSKLMLAPPSIGLRLLRPLRYGRRRPKAVELSATTTQSSTTRIVPNNEIADQGIFIWIRQSNRDKHDGVSYYDQYCWGRFLNISFASVLGATVTSRYIFSGRFVMPSGNLKS